MWIFIALFMSIAINLDNFVIGIQLGMKKQPIPILSNLIISAFTGVFSGLAALCPEIFPQVMVSAANVTGSLIILVFGVYCLLRQPDTQSIQDTAPPLTFKGSCILGFTLAVNCIPPSLGAGILGISPLYMAIFGAACSFICMHISSRIGSRLSRGKWMMEFDKISALLLICIGLTELFI